MEGYEVKNRRAFEFARISSNLLVSIIAAPRACFKRIRRSIADLCTAIERL